ncbi:hypothetical protein RRF57_012862 [Xylaria bambusicola]|uniref:Zn(2)-C6 fungal-type domain-containing protein n=1 Tax=Xylaria bambusicola TaxID=326684 RepID=A0AAN7UQP6_9PEZI
MFATWKYDPKDNDVVLSTQALTFDPVTAKTTGTKACFLCRTKKLRCDGDRNGCQRCKSHGQECKYVDTARQQKKANSTKNLEHRERSKSSSSMTSLASSSRLPNAEQQQQQPEQQQEQRQECQKQQRKQQQDDFSWLLAQPPSIDFFAEHDLMHDSAVQSVPMACLGDVGAIADPSDIDADLSSSLLKTYSTLYPNFTLDKSLSIGADNEAEVAFKPHGSSSAPCDCLYRIVIVMDKLGVQDDCAMEESLNNLLILYKEALGNSTTMLDCVICTGRVENMLILAILMDKLARLSYQIVQITENSIHPTPILNLGDYKVDSAEEYAALIGSLLGVQLRRLQVLAQSLHQVSSHFHSETLEHRLTVCRGFVARSLDALRNCG